MEPKWVLFKADETPAVPGTPGVNRIFFTGAATGSQHLSTGITQFEAGTGLFWHFHTVDESITILEGEPTCEVGGPGRPVESARLKPYDTVFIPAHTPHRFINQSGRPARILWSYPTGRIERYPINPDGSSANPEGAGR